MANKNESNPDVYCLLGPTASGKTDLAVELVQLHPFEIISVDSAQIYRGMDIGTGKPSKKALNVAPHRLVDIKDPSESYSAAEFKRDATREISSIVDSGKVPLLVGGTMLYFRVLRDGMAELPRANKKIRQDIEETAKNHGWVEVHRQLAKVDPDAAARIHLNDPQRLQRALEVFLVSGKKMTDFFNEEKNRPGDKNKQSFNFHFFGIQPADRVVLNSVIERRFAKMLENGLIAEVELLYERGDLTKKMPSIRSVGYRQIWDYLAGNSVYHEMVERSTAATRQLAKRQSTWMKSWAKLNLLTDCRNQARDHILKYVETGSI